MKNVKKLSLLLIVALVLVGGFGGYKIALAVNGEGTANIDGGAAGGNVTVDKATSHVFTIVLTVGASGITANAENPTFTIPAGFTAPDATYVANAGLVVADGDWSVIGGGTCLVESPVAGLTKAVGQVITVDVSTACTVGAGGIITLTYKGKSAAAMGATALNIGVNASISYAPVTPIANPPTITVADTIFPNVIITMDDYALTVGDTSLVTFTFSEAPTGFTTDDVTVANGSIGAIDASNPLIQTAIYTPTNGIEDATNVITVGTDWTNAALNAGIGDDSPNYTIDTIADTPTSTYTTTGSGLSPVEGRINVVKLVVNDNGGTKTIADFPLFVNSIPVVSGVTNTFPVTGSTYSVSEILDSNYTRTFSGDCNSNGKVVLNSQDNRFCIVTNDDIGTPVVVPPVPPLIDVVKVPNPLALPAGPGSVTYTYTLKNIGTVPVTGITMVGDTCSPIVLASGDTNYDSKLDVNETWVYHCSTTLTKTHTNIVTTTGWANGISATDIASATVVVGAPVVSPLIHVTKVPSPLALRAGSGAITYKYTVTNPGTAPLSNVSIIDDKCTGLPGRVLGHPGDINKNNLLESNEAWSFTCQSNLTKTTTNTATASGEANGLTARDVAIATVVVSNAVPALPNTGFAPNSTPWNIVMLVGALMLISASLAVVLRKRTI